MQGTKERILEIVIQQREARVEDLARTLEITAAAVRRHLDHLRADGLIDVRAVRQATGRPYYAYFPTERAEGSLPRGYARFLEDILQGLGDRPEVADQVVASMAEAVAARHVRDDDRSEDSAARFDRVTGSLRQEGILETWHNGADGVHLMNGSCPYLKAAELSKLPCESDRKTIEVLLGVNVEQLHRIVDGAPVCEYVVRTARNTQDPQLAG